MKTHHVPPEIDATILSLCESLEALLDHADMGEIHDDETQEVVERAKTVLASALALRLCAVQ